MDNVEELLNHLTDSDDSDEDVELETRINAVRYLEDESFQFSYDVYQLTIAFNFKNNGNYREFFYGVRQCVYCFICQSMIAIYFAYELLAFKSFALTNWNLPNCFVRIICNIMLQLSLNRELQKATQCLAFVKYA